MSTCAQARQLGVTCFVLIGALLLGVDIVYLASMVFWESFKRDVAHLEDPAHQELPVMTMTQIQSIFSVGCFLTAIPISSSFFIDGFGRRTSIIIGASVSCAGSLVQAISGSVIQLLVGRFISGLALGLLSTVLPLYIGEIAESDIRGTLLVLYQVMILVGITVGSVVNEEVKELHDGWRISIGVQVAFSAVLLLGMPFLPCSPRWLVQQGRVQDALATLRSLRPSGNASELELAEITSNHEEAAALGQPRWGELFTGHIGKLVMIGAVLQGLQQLIFQLGTFSLGSGLAQSMGFSRDRFTSVASVVMLLTMLPSLYLVDRVGRRPLLVAGAVCMLAACVVYGILGVLFTEQVDTYTWRAHNEPAGWVIIVCVFVFMSGFCVSWAPVVWAYCAEMFPMKHRSRCVGTTTAVNWGFTVLVNQVGTYTYTHLGYWTALGQVIILCICWRVACWLPETKGVGLEEIDRLFQAKLRPRTLPTTKDIKSDSGGSSTSDGEGSSGDSE